MADRMQQARTEELDKQTNAFVASVIRYLDSATDYREYLSCSRRTTSVEDDKLVLLDDIPRFAQMRLWRITLFMAVVVVILLAFLRS